MRPDGFGVPGDLGGELVEVVHAGEEERDDFFARLELAEVVDAVQQRFDRVKIGADALEADAVCRAFERVEYAVSGLDLLGGIVVPLPCEDRLFEVLRLVAGIERECAE